MAAEMDADNVLYTEALSMPMRTVFNADDLHNRWGVPNSTISGWVKDKVLPPHNVVTASGRALGWDIAAVLYIEATVDEVRDRRPDVRLAQ